MRLAIGCLVSLSLVTSGLAQSNRYQPAQPLPLMQDQGQPAQQPDSQQRLSSSFDGINTGGTPPMPSSRPAASAPATPPPSLPQLPHNAPATTRAQHQSRPAERTVATSSTRYSPAQLMQGMLKQSRNSQLAGQPVKLETIVANCQTRAEQTQRINAYWDLCSSTADYYLGLAEAEELRRLQQRAGSGSSALNEAISQWRNRIGTSQLAAMAAQRRLASMMGSGSLPLPGDAPLCGAYKTRYDQVFAGRASEEARVLDQLIPQRHAELSAAAAAVSRSQDFAASIKQRDPTGEGMVRALELLALSRRAFVQIAKDYNRQITRYTELSTPGKIETARLVAMLVERPRNSSTASQSRPLTFRRGLQ